MCSDWDSFIDDLDGHTPQAKAGSTNEQRFPCGQCAGSGHWVSPMGRKTGKCHACNGKGYFKTDPRKLAQNRAKSRQRKADKIRAGIEAFKEQNPAMFSDLRNAHDLQMGNSFILSLADQLFTKGQLSDRQIEAWARGKAKMEAMKAEQEKAATKADLEPIRQMFETAHASGYKAPKYRAEGLVISRAGDYSRNPGALYVKNDEDEYLGKVVGTHFFPVRTAPTNTTEKLATIAQDPKAAAIRWGQRTGRCSCCGRELTNHASIDAGIGPICAEKWGF